MLHSPTTLLPSHSLPPLMPSFSPGWGSSGYSGYCLLLKQNIYQVFHRTTVLTLQVL